MISYIKFNLAWNLPFCLLIHSIVNIEIEEYTGHDVKKLVCISTSIWLSNENVTEEKLGQNFENAVVLATSAD